MVVSHESGGIQPSLFAKLLLLASNPVPGQLFQSVSLPVDACLSEKIRAKIWKEKYVDFGSLLANPVLIDRYQIQTAVIPPLFALNHWLSTKRLQQLKRG